MAQPNAPNDQDTSLGQRHWDDSVARQLSSAETTDTRPDMSEFEDDYNTKPAPSEDEEHAILRANSRNQDAVRALESNPLTTISHISTATGANPTNKQELAKVLLKRGAPAGAIVGILLSLAGLVSFFGGPGLLVVNLAEVMTEKFNYQLGTMSPRSDRIIQAKLTNTTTGVCGVIPINCKYSSFSDKEIKNFEEAGFKVNADKKTILGRNKIESLELEPGKPVPASKVASELKTNAKFNAAMKTAYKIKYVGMSDNVFSRVAQKLGFSKKAPFEGDTTDEERAKTVAEDTKTGRSTPETITECAKPQCTEAEKAAAEKAKAKSASTLADTASDGTNKGAAIISESAAIEEAAKKGTLSTLGGAAGSVIKITGPVDNACMVYGWIKTISLTSKVILAAQMARYAMIFLTTASQIKAGDAKPEDVTYVGDILTKIVNDENGNVSKAATDSFGYRYAAYGDAGINREASPYVAGASFGGDIQTAVSMILALLPGSKAGMEQSCGVLANPFVQVGSLIVGAVGFFVGASEVKITIQAAIAPAIAIVGLFLPAMIGTILAGNLVDKNTYGEASGNIITSGSGALLSKVASNGGGAIMTPADAQAYMQVQKKVLADYAEYDRQTLSPFDASSPNTLLGSVYTRFAPYISKSSGSAYGAFSSISSIVGSTLSSLLSPKARAVTQESYTECKDSSYRDLNIATDPFCNPVIGIPPKYLSDDPTTINNRLLAQGMIDETTGDPKGDTYKNFVSNCIERENPYGSSADGEVDNTKDCFIDTQQKADMYVHYVDQRTLNDSENDMPVTTSSAVTTPVTGSTDLGWPLDKSYYDQNTADWLGPHTLRSGTFTSPYAQGVAADISTTPQGTPIYSMYTGVVDRVNFCGEGDGMMIKSNVAGGTVEVAYGHGTSPLFTVGQTVNAGQQILSLNGVGCKTTGPHLHIDMTYNGLHVCPQDIFLALSAGQTPDYNALTAKANPGCTGRG